MHRIFMSGDVADSEIRCKGRYKKSTPEEECEISADNAKTLRFSAYSLRSMQIFCV